MVDLEKAQQEITNLQQEVALTVQKKDMERHKLEENYADLKQEV